MLKVKRRQSAIVDLEVSIEACKKEIKSWGYTIDDKHVWYLENAFQLEDDGRYNLYMNSKCFGFIADEDKPQADNEIVFCELIKKMPIDTWVYFDINNSTMVDLVQYVDGNDTYGRYLDRMKISAFNKSGTPLSLSNFVSTGPKGYQEAGDYFKNQLAYLSIQEPQVVCKNLAKDNRIFNKEFKVVKNEWDRCEIATKDALGNEAYIRVIF